MAGRVILSGTVHVKHGLEYKMRHLTLRCQGSVYPATLEVFSIDNKTRLQELSFIKLQDVTSEGSDSEKLIILKMREGEGLTFCAQSEIEHNTWYIYCYVLANIPTYPIPDVSHYHIPLDSFKQEIDPKLLNAISVWRVYIINEGVGKALKCRGFQNITINRNSTISIVNCSSHVPIATWDRDKIRRSGCLDSLVFLEAGRRCQGGAGMLWMYCPQFSASFGKCLHRFLFNKTTEGDTANLQSPMYPKNLARSVGNLVDFDEDLAVTRQPATLPKSSASHNTDFSRHQHMCSASPARYLGLVPKSHTVSTGSLILSEECSRHNEYCTSHTESDIERCSCSCSNNRNVKCDTSHKPPILPRKTKKNKPPIPPRKFGPSVNHSDFSEHDTMAASKNGTRLSAMLGSQIVASPVNDGHQKQIKTHERVVLRPKNVKRFSGDLRAIELNTLLGCWVELSETLDITSILPQLCSHHLLTMYDREKLSNANTTNCEKVTHLLNVLPKKDKGWLTKFLDCLCKSTEGTGHAGLATKLRVTYEEELKKYEHSTRTMAGSVNQEVLTTKPKESFPVYLELQEGSSPHVFNVTSTELVESLIERIHTELDITCPFDIRLKVDPSQKRLPSRSSLAQSQVSRNSFITMVTHDLKLS